jgi:hypothetical protein
MMAFQKYMHDTQLYTEGKLSVTSIKLCPRFSTNVMVIYLSLRKVLFGTCYIIICTLNSNHDVYLIFLIIM